MSINNAAAAAPQNKTKMIVINGLFIALTLVATMFINIRLPLVGNGGLIHLGNVPMFLGAFVFGRRTGAIAGGIGMSLFDLISGSDRMGAFYPCNCSSYGICFRPYFRKTQSTPCNSKHCCGNRGACYKNRGILLHRGYSVRQLDCAFRLYPGKYSSGCRCGNYRNTFCRQA